MRMVARDIADDELLEMSRHDPLSFVYAVASDRHRGAERGDAVREKVVELISSCDEDIAAQAMDAAMIRMGMKEAYSKLQARLPQERSEIVLTSIIYSIYSMSKRNLIGRDQALHDMLSAVSQCFTVRARNVQVIDDALGYLSEIYRKEMNV